MNVLCDWLSHSLVHGKVLQHCHSHSSHAHRPLPSPHLPPLLQTAYESMRFRDALRDGFYELQISRDSYRDMCAKLDIVSGRI